MKPDTRVSRRLIKRLSLDALMLALILVEFAYPLTGNLAHELIGIGMLVLFLVHGGLNWPWFRTLRKGRYNGLRRVSVSVNALLLAAALMLILSGLLNSHLLSSLAGFEFHFLPRELHTAAAYWFLILMAVHLGLHWKTVLAEARKLPGGAKPSRLRRIALPAISAAIVIAGIHASFERGVLSKLTAYYSFDYWDFDGSVAGFFIQYLSIVGLYASLAYYALQWHKSRKRSPGRFRSGLLSAIGALRKR